MIRNLLQLASAAVIVIALVGLSGCGSSSAPSTGSSTQAGHYEGDGHDHSKDTAGHHEGDGHDHEKEKEAEHK